MTKSLGGLKKVRCRASQSAGKYVSGGLWLLAVILQLEPVMCLSSGMEIMTKMSDAGASLERNQTRHESKGVGHGEPMLRHTSDHTGKVASLQGIDSHEAVRHEDIPVPETIDSYEIWHADKTLVSHGTMSEHSVWHEWLHEGPPEWWRDMIMIADPECLPRQVALPTWSQEYSPTWRIRRRRLSEREMILRRWTSCLYGNPIFQDHCFFQSVAMGLGWETPQSQSKKNAMAMRRIAARQLEVMPAVLDWASRSLQCTASEYLAQLRTRMWGGRAELSYRASPPLQCSHMHMEP